MTPELLQFIANCKAITAEQNEPKQSRPKIEIKTSINESGAMVGDVLGCSWGYDQTNYDFYEVISVTAKTVTVKKLTGHDTGTILKSRRVGGSREEGYSIRVYDFAHAHFDPSDPKCEQYIAYATEENNSPYRYR